MWRVLCAKTLHQGTWALRKSFHTFSQQFGIVPFKLADIGEGISEVEVLQWYVKPGDSVNEFDKICEVQSDKATVEITSRYTGKIHTLHYKVSDMASVGKPLVDIEIPDDMDDTAQSSSQPVSSSEKSTMPSSAPQSAETTHICSAKVLAAPTVRRIAKELNLDLLKVTPTGKGGRILKEDLFSYQENQGNSSVKTDTFQYSPSSQNSASIETNSYSLQDKIIPVRGIQKVMVKSMTAANAIPHFGFHDEIEMNQCMEFRKKIQPFAEKKGVKLSYLPFFIKAASLALHEYPQVNCHVNSDCSEITVKGSHNIGLAMDTPHGLFVPNIKNVQFKSLLDIALDLNRLQTLGMAGKLGKEDITGGTLTLSNIGSIGGTYASPILFAPEAAICALGKIQKLPRFDSQGNVKALNIMKISWSGDHRALDGATLARFSCAWKELIENPEIFLLNAK